MCSIIAFVLRILFTKAKNTDQGFSCREVQLAKNVWCVARHIKNEKYYKS